MLIYSPKTLGVLKCLDKAALPVIWRSNFIDGFKHHFVPEVIFYLCSKNLAFKVFFILDSRTYPKLLEELHPHVKVFTTKCNIFNTTTGLRTIHKK